MPEDLNKFVGLGEVVLALPGFLHQSRAILSPVKVWRSYITPADYSIAEITVLAARPLSGTVMKSTPSVRIAGCMITSRISEYHPF